MTPAEQDLIRQATDRIQAMGAGVRRIILFGSRATGRAAADSDYDILVVLDFKPVDKRLWRKRLYRSLRGLGGMIEPWVMSEEEFQETRNIVGSLAHPADRDGVPIYEKP